MKSIGDAWGFSGQTPITPSGGFSVETLTGVTLSWKTKLNRSIFTIEDRIPGWLQHCYETRCKKGGHRGRRACIFWRWLYHRDVVSGQVDLHMTPCQIHVIAILEELCLFFSKNSANSIEFWECPSHLNWHLHKAVDCKSKASNPTPIFPCKTS